MADNFILLVLPVDFLST